MLYYIYDQKPINEKTKLMSCMVYKDKGFAPPETKFTFEVVGINEVFPEAWKAWFFNGSKNPNLWLNELTIDNFEPLNRDSSKGLVGAYKAIFQEEWEKHIVKINTKNILNTTVSDIINKLKTTKEESEIKELDKQIAFSMTLIKIAAYLEEYPEQMTEFPLYLSYLKKHKLTSDEYPVEDFVLDITNAATCMDS